MTPREIVVSPGCSAGLAEEIPAHENAGVKGIDVSCRGVEVGILLPGWIRQAYGIFIIPQLGITVSGHRQVIVARPLDGLPSRI